MEDIFDLICILFVLTLVFGFLSSIFENSVEFDSYFLKHSDEFIIIDYYIGNTRFGYNSYHVIAKHIKTDKLYDYKVNINDFVYFGGVLDDERI